METRSDTGKGVRRVNEVFVHFIDHHWVIIGKAADVQNIYMKLDRETTDTVDISEFGNGYCVLVAKQELGE